MGAAALSGLRYAICCRGIAAQNPGAPRGPTGAADRGDAGGSITDWAFLRGVDSRDTFHARDLCTVYQCWSDANPAHSGLENRCRTSCRSRLV